MIKAIYLKLEFFPQLLYKSPNIFTEIVLLVIFCETKIDEINHIELAIWSDHEILWFDVPMDEIMIMKNFQAKKNLVCNVHACRYGEMLTTFLENMIEILP